MPVRKKHGSRAPVPPLRPNLARAASRRGRSSNITSTRAARIAVLCPMAIEYRAIMRRLFAAGLAERTVVVQTGIGKRAVIAAMDGVAEAWGDNPGPRLLVLAGTCGGLANTDDVPQIRAVIDEHGRRWPCAPQWNRCGKPGSDSAPSAAATHRVIRSATHGTDGVDLVGVDRIISTPADKSALAAASGASIVDMESHAFIERCERIAERSRLQLDWSIVRGVSDTPKETLPPRVLSWVNAAGNARGVVAARDMVLRPNLIPRVLGVVRRSNRVLPKVGLRVVQIAELWLAQHGERVDTTTPIAPGPRA